MDPSGHSLGAPGPGGSPESIGGSDPSGSGVSDHGSNTEKGGETSDKGSWAHHNSLGSLKDRTTGDKSIVQVVKTKTTGLFTVSVVQITIVHSPNTISHTSLAGADSGAFAGIAYGIYEGVTNTDLVSGLI